MGLLRDAEFIVATSFHAAVFALLFHKRFAIIPPRINTARIEQLLQYVGLEDHIITDVNQMDRAFAPIDYTAVDARLDILRADSRKWLKDTLQQFECDMGESDD